MRLGLHDAANAGLHSAIEEYRKLGNPRGEAEARRRLGLLMGSQNLGAEARDEYQRAMAIYKATGDLGGVGAVYRDLCEMLWDAGDRDGALAAARQGLEISRQTGDLKMQAWTLRAVANVAADESAGDEVMGDFREVMALTERSGDRGGHAWSLANYADVARLRGDMTVAGASCDKALKEASELTDPQFFIFAKFTCALVAVDQGRNERAQTMLKEVAQQSAASNDRIYLADALTTLAQLDMESSHCPEAKDRLRKAIDLFAAAEATTGQANAEALYALCAQNSGETAARDQVIAQARMLRTGITSRQEVYYTDIVLLQLGSDGDSKSSRIESLNRLATDAAKRHWLGWSLEAKLSAWQLTEANGDRMLAQRMRKDLERLAKQHGMGRILARLRYLSATSIKMTDSTTKPRQTVPPS